MTRHSLLWLIAIILIFLISPLIVTQAQYEDCAGNELARADEWYTPREVKSIVDRTDNLYALLLVKTGIDPALRKHFLKPTNVEEIAPGVSMPANLQGYASHMMQYWGNLLNNIWLFLLRCSHATAWLKYLWPYMAAVMFDGLMRRKAKLASFQYTSPTLYNASWHAIIALVSCALVVFALVVPISLFAYPALFTCIGLLLRLLIANIQHSA